MAGRGETDDLASLAKLDEATLLEELKSRYKRDKIYVSVRQQTSHKFIHRQLLSFMNKCHTKQTYLGDVLVAVNPFKQLPLYDAEVQ